MTPEQPRATDGAQPVGRPTPAGVGDLLFPAVLVAVAAYVVVSSFGYGLWARLGPGPGFFPLVLGGLLGVLSLAWLTTELRTRRRGQAGQPVRAASDPLEPGADEPVLQPRLVAVIVASLVALAVLMVVIGYQLSMLLFLVFHLKVVGRRGWLLTAVVAVIGSFGVFTVFTQLLSVNLPTASIELLRLMGL